jgi:SNF2 family DNA or RNA helicase
MLVVDESTRFKNPSANRTRTLIALLDLFYRRYILTGYPAPNGYMDLFSQLYLLDQGETLGNNYTTYQRTYFYTDDTGKFSRPQPREGAVDKINKAMASVISQLTVEDVMQLPKLNHVPIYVRPDKGFLKRYERLEKTLVVEIENVTTAFQLTAATSLMKTRQFVNGFVYDENREPIILNDIKLQSLNEFVVSLGGKPVLIFYVFDVDGRRIMESLDVPVKERIHGGLSHKDKTEIFNRWNDKQIDALICQPSTMAHGSNIQHGGSIIIFFSLMFDFELYYQGYRRLWRSGQKHPTYIYYLQVLNTVDEDIYRAIRGDKTKIYESFINYFKTRAAKSVKKQTTMRVLN